MSVPETHASVSSVPADQPASTGTTTAPAPSASSATPATVTTATKPTDVPADAHRSALGQGKQTAPADTAAKKPAEKPAGAVATPAPEPIKILLPEGVQVDEAEVKAFMPTFQEIGLNSEQASKLAKVYAEQRQTARQAAVEAYEAKSQQMFEELRADKEFGGAKHEENLACAREAIKRCPNHPQLTAQLVEYGVDNLTELVKAFAFLGRGMREDSSGSRVPGSTKKTEREKLNDWYPSSADVGNPRS